jgi:3-oxoacyl-[acyl-carrier-protein] synthase-1
MQPLRLSHMCIATTLGRGLDAQFVALRTGRSGLAPCVFEDVELATHVGAIDALDHMQLAPSLLAYNCRNNRAAELALRQDGFDDAMAAARERYGSSRIGVFLGTSTSGILEAEHAYQARDPDTGRLPAQFRYATTHNTHSLASFVQRRFGLSGPSLVVSCACASTGKAFGNAARAMAAGLCDAAIVGGADTLCLTTLHGFASLQLVSPEPCRPCDGARDGISIGEAAGFVLLERGDAHAGDVLFGGLGESNDAYHMSAPHPQGAGARLAIARALQAAGLQEADIDYVNLHATATLVGDKAEDHAVFDTFGGQTPCSSTKGLTGHTLGAAGIVEAIFCALALRHQFIPGCAHLRTRDSEFRSNVVRMGRAADLRRVMSNSFGFGGSNCSIILELAA